MLYLAPMLSGCVLVLAIRCGDRFRHSGGGNDPNPYADGCATSADRPSCNCDGVRPPFGAPDRPVPLQKDYHFPECGQRRHRFGLIPQPHGTPHAPRC